MVNLRYYKNKTASGMWKQSFSTQNSSKLLPCKITFCLFFVSKITLILFEIEKNLWS